MGSKGLGWLQGRFKRVVITGTLLAMGSLIFGRVGVGRASVESGTVFKAWIVLFVLMLIVKAVMEAIETIRNTETERQATLIVATVVPYGLVVALLGSVEYFAVAILLGREPHGLFAALPGTLGMAFAGYVLLLCGLAVVRLALSLLPSIKRQFYEGQYVGAGLLLAASVFALLVLYLLIRL
jgi:hypothetical protein